MTEEFRPIDVSLPRRLDRRMRLGPFPSAREAMRFAAYAAAGAVVLPFGGAVAWLPVLVGAFLLAVYRPDGKGVDERAGDYLRWRLRQRGRGVNRSVPTVAVHPEGFVRLPGGFVGAVIEAGGVPMRFLPPSDARELFGQYRSMLRSGRGDLHLEAGAAPIPYGPFRLPDWEGAGEREAAARSGYSEMVRLLLKQRWRRRVLVVAFAPLRAGDALHRLNGEMDALLGHLAAMGIEAERLQGSSLRVAVSTIGWRSGRTP